MGCSCLVQLLVYQLRDIYPLYQMKLCPNREYFDIVLLIVRCVAVRRGSTDSYIGVFDRLGSIRS